MWLWRWYMDADMEHSTACCLALAVWITIKGSIWVDETAPVSAAASNSLSHLGSFTHTFPTGMEPLEPARRANGEHARFHTSAHMAANMWRTFSTFIWIVTLVSSSRTRIYPPNEGKWGGRKRWWRWETRSGFPLVDGGRDAAACAPCASRRMEKSRAKMHDTSKVGFLGDCHSFWRFLMVSDRVAPPRSSATCSLFPWLSWKIFCFFDIFSCGHSSEQCSVKHWGYVLIING